MAKKARVWKRKVWCKGRKTGKKSNRKAPESSFIQKDSWRRKRARDERDK